MGKNHFVEVIWTKTITKWSLIYKAQFMFVCLFIYASKTQTKKKLLNQIHPNFTWCQRIPQGWFLCGQHIRGREFRKGERPQLSLRKCVSCSNPDVLRYYKSSFHRKRKLKQVENMHYGDVEFSLRIINSYFQNV